MGFSRSRDEVSHGSLGMVIVSCLSVYLIDDCNDRTEEHSNLIDLGIAYFPII